MKKIINQAEWNRKEYYDFFSSFDEPFFGITAEINCTSGYQKAKEAGVSFFIYYLHKSLKAINEIPELRTRIVDNNIVEFDLVHASSTIGREDNSFGYSFIEYRELFDDFLHLAEKEMKFVRSVSGLNLNDKTGRPDVIHYSPIPWIKFSGLTHARNFKVKDSIPKVTFGKLYEEAGVLKMPVAVNLHHGLADAYHASKFLNSFENLMK